MKKVLLSIVLFLSFSPLVFPGERTSVQLSAGPLFLTKTDFAKIGYSASASFLFNLSAGFDLSLRSGYLSWTIEEKNMSDISINTYSIPVLIGTRYYFFNQGIQPYILLEGGISYVHSKTSGIQKFGPLYIKESNGSWTGITFGAGLGFQYLINDRINLDIQAAAQHPEISHEYIQLLAGLRIKI